MLWSSIKLPLHLFLGYLVALRKQQSNELNLSEHMQGNSIHQLLGRHHLNNATEGAGERSYKTWAEYMPLFLYWMETFSLLINYSFMHDYFFTP